MRPSPAPQVYARRRASPEIRHTLCVAVAHAGRVRTNGRANQVRRRGVRARSIPCAGAAVGHVRAGGAEPEPRRRRYAVRQSAGRRHQSRSPVPHAAAPSGTRQRVRGWATHERARCVHVHGAQEGRLCARGAVHRLPAHPTAGLGRRAQCVPRPWRHPVDQGGPYPRRRARHGQRRRGRRYDGQENLHRLRQHQPIGRLGAAGDVDGAGRDDRAGRQGAGTRQRQGGGADRWQADRAYRLRLTERIGQPPGIGARAHRDHQ